jgi:hypothetical protein
MFSLVPIVPVFLEKKFRESIKHAKLICPGHEDTRECKLAWDRVEDLQKAINKRKDSAPPKKDDFCDWDEVACREYDV